MKKPHFSENPNEDEQKQIEKRLIKLIKDVLA